MSTSNLITVAPSPHSFGKENVSGIMFRVILALVPALALSLVFFGLGALIVTSVAIVSCVLFEYLIKTYTNEGETVLDFTMGSGSTGIACKNLDRRFIGIEKEENYFKIAKNRIKERCI